MKLTVFLSSSSSTPEIYSRTVAEFGFGLVKNGHELVYGGSDLGLMKVLADAVRFSGGKVMSITTKHLEQFARKDVDEVVMTSDFAERKKLLLERGDALVVLPGGIGTFDEATDAIALREHNLYRKPIFFLNTNGYYDGFKIQLNTMFDQGFKDRNTADFIVFSDSVDELFAGIRKTVECTRIS